MKIVHYFWDDAKVAFVTISNTPLDAAKTNRAAMCFRSEPSSDDLRKLAHSFFSTNILPNCSAYMQRCIKACCQAYIALIARKETGQKRHLRDFHHFLKYFNRRCRYLYIEAAATTTFLCSWHIPCPIQCQHGASLQACSNNPLNATGTSLV